MTLRNTDALIVETTGVAESLPDPTTVAQRTHQLANTGAAAAVWSSTGATPFTENGINVATISVPAGAAKIVQSNGTRWVVAPSAADVQLQRTAIVTDAAGNATWVFPTPYAAAPRVTYAVGPSGDVALVEARITTLTATQVTVNVRRSPSVVVLGIALLSFPSNAPGVPIQLIAVAQ